MTLHIDRTEPTSEKNDATSPDNQEQRKLDRIADRAARRGEERERRYDEEHDIFSK
jgi:hypothetical protein